MSTIKTITRFLSHFEYEKYTIQVLLDQNQDPTALNTKHFKSKKYVQEKYPEATKSKTSHAFTLTQLRDERVLGELELAQRSGRAVWWMVNEGNGNLQLPDSPNCVSQSNVKRITSCFIDTDDCPISTVKTYLEEIGIKPHLVVQTSPKKYHLYFLLRPFDRSPSEEFRWKCVQKALAHLSVPGKETGLDQSMHDVSKVLRLPGFKHLKGDPFLVRLKHEYDHSRYTLDDLYRKTNAEKFADEIRENRNQYQLPASLITAGQRHQAITEYVSSRSNFIDGKDLLFSTYGFIQANIDKPQTFLPNGTRHHETQAAVDYFVQKREKESAVQLKADTVQLLDQENKDPFQLSRNFYEECPGIAGRIIKEILSRAMYPTPSYTFATVLSALGTLKAGNVTTEHGHAPVNYFLCLGASGVGKAYAQETLSHTFTKLGIGRLIEHKIRSDRGIITFLNNNNSTGMILLDEGESFLSNLYSKESPSYLRSCKELLLTLYTSTNYPELGCGHVGSSKEEPTVLHYPRLNVVSYGVMHTLDHAFSKVSIKDGLLQRFLVVTHYEPRMQNPNNKPAKHLNGELIEELREMVSSSRLTREKDYLEVTELENEIAAEEDLERKAELQAKLDLFLKEKFNKPKTKLRFTGKASAVWRAYIKDMDQLYNRETSKQTGLEGLYTRAAEQVGRLCAVLSGSDVRAATVDYCVEFVNSRVGAIKGYCEESMDRGELGKDIEELTKFIANRLRVMKVPAITYREIIRGFRIRDSRKLKELLKDAEDAGTVLVRENYRRPGHGGKRGTAYTLGEI